MPFRLLPHGAALLPARSIAHTAGRAGPASLAGLVTSLALATSGLAQSVPPATAPLGGPSEPAAPYAAPPQEAPPQEAPQQGMPSRRPGLFDEVGGWFGSGLKSLEAGTRAAQDAVRDATDGLPSPSLPTPALSWPNLALPSLPWPSRSAASETPAPAEPASEAAAPSPAAPDPASTAATVPEQAPQKTEAPGKSLLEAAAGLADGIGSAASAIGVGRMAGTTVKGREKCRPGANGAPDCAAAATILCKAKGYQDGSSVDTETSRSCSAQALIATGSASRACGTEYHVTRAVCR